MDVKADEFALALGRFSIEFLAMEERVDQTILTILGLFNTTAGFALTAAIFNFTTRLEILYGLAHNIPLEEPHRATIMSAVDEAWDLNSFRNWLFHTSWLGQNWLGKLGEPVGEPKHLKGRMQSSGKTRAWKVRDFTTTEVDKQRERCENVSRLLVREFAVLGGKIPQKNRDKTK